MIDTVLFDLDGTLLPMDQEEFLQAYLGLLAKKLAPQGYDANHLIAAIWAGTGAMVENDGSKTNEEAFWDDFCEIFGPDARKDMPLFEEFYAADFGQVRTVCGFAPEAEEIVRLLKDRGLTVALATNPLFPEIATRQRIRWAGMEPEDFALVTTYETSRHCKPNPDYYRDVLAALGKEPEQCLMVGNDVAEDMVPARAVGMQVFLLTPCIINKKGTDIAQFPHGDFAALRTFLMEQT